MIKWCYRYVGSGEEIFPDSKIITTPDKQGRWAAIGYVHVKTKELPEYKVFGNKMLVKIAWITRQEYKKGRKKHVEYNCHFSCISGANEGLTQYNLTNENPQLLMREIEKKFEKTLIYFKSIVKPKK